MATRYYLTDDSTSIAPSINGSWDNTSSTRYALSTTRGGDSVFTSSSLAVSNGDTTTLRRRWIGPGMAASILFNSSTTFELCIRCDESTSSGDLYLRVHMFIVSNDGGTVRAFSWTAQDGTEFGTTFTSRSLTYSGASGSYTTVAGDRIVIEVGWYKGASGSVTGNIQWGSASASNDLVGDGDIGSPDNAWFETNATVGTGGGAEPPPPSTIEDYSIEGYITGVLDDWA